MSNGPYRIENYEGVPWIRDRYGNGVVSERSGLRDICDALNDAADAAVAARAALYPKLVEMLKDVRSYGYELPHSREIELDALLAKVLAIDAGEGEHP